MPQNVSKGSAREITYSCQARGIDWTLSGETLVATWRNFGRRKQRVYKLEELGSEPVVFTRHFPIFVILPLAFGAVAFLVTLAIERAYPDIGIVYVGSLAAVGLASRAVLGIRPLTFARFFDNSGKVAAEIEQERGREIKFNDFVSELQKRITAVKQHAA